ncbi:hypothetical protein B0H10DRAFT_1997973 [Mycena sp. CBHHK59/15]|nr:hypothetical protein B0H10DRAFT_1997973 [Mycena sp. CBHHK59/15]
MAPYPGLYMQHLSIWLFGWLKQTTSLVPSKSHLIRGLITFRQQMEHSFDILTFLHTGPSTHRGLRNSALKRQKILDFLPWS